MWVFLMPNMYWAMVWTVALMLPFVPCIPVHSREFRKAFEAEARRAERLRREQYARDREHDMQIFGAVRSHVAKGNFDTALSCVHGFHTQEMADQARQYVMDHWHRFGPLVGRCVRCGKLVEVASEDEEKECTTCVLIDYM